MRHKWPDLSLTRQIQLAFAVAAIVRPGNALGFQHPTGGIRPRRVSGEAADSGRLAGRARPKGVPSSTLFRHPPLGADGAANASRVTQGITAIQLTRVESTRKQGSSESVPSSTLPSPPCASDGRGPAPTIRGATRANAHRHRVHRRLYTIPNLAVEKKPASRRAPDLLAIPHSRGLPLNNSLMTWRMRVSCASDRTPVLIFTVKLFTSLVMLPA